MPAPLDAEEKARQEKKAADEAARQAARVVNLCRADPGTPFALRKKVLVLAMPLARPADAADLPGISSAWSQALQAQLASSDHFLVRDGSAHLIGPDAEASAQIIRLARHFDAQFIIAGHIDSLAIEPGQIEFKHLSALSRLRPIPLAMFDLRSIVTRFEIFDASGVRIARLDQHDEIDGEVRNRNPGVMQGSFFQSRLGTALAAVLKRQFEDIEDELACLPMAAAARPLADGRISLAAGFTSGVQPGMRLRLSIDAARPARGPATPLANRTLGEVVVEQVYPEHAIARFDSSLQPQWRGPGVVRAW